MNHLYRVAFIDKHSVSGLLLYRQTDMNNTRHSLNIDTVFMFMLQLIVEWSQYQSHVFSLQYPEISEKSHG